MITLTTTRYFGLSGDCIRQQKTLCLFGWVIYRWQDCESRTQPDN